MNKTLVSDLRCTDLPIYSISAAPKYFSSLADKSYRTFILFPVEKWNVQKQNTWIRLLYLIYDSNSCFPLHPHAAEQNTSPAFSVSIHSFIFLFLLGFNAAHCCKKRNSSKTLRWYYTVSSVLYPSPREEANNTEAVCPWAPVYPWNYPEGNINLI